MFGHNFGFSPDITSFEKNGRNDLVDATIEATTKRRGPLFGDGSSLTLQHFEHDSTWWLIPLSKWVITPVISG